MKVCGWIATLFCVATITAAALGNSTVADALAMCVVFILLAGAVAVPLRL